MPISLISVYNQSKRLNDIQVQAMISAVGKQLARDVAPIWGATPTLEFVPTGKKGNGIPCTFSDTPDIPGIAGYHDEDDNGVPYIKVFVSPTLDNGGSVLVGANSVSVTFSHEVLELVGDASANLWADANSNTDYARELCDAVESDSYLIDGVSVSNFVYPSFFDPKAAPGEKLDFMSLVTTPFEIRPGGYQIKRTEPGDITDVYQRRLACYQTHRPSRTVIVDFGKDYPSHKINSKLEKVRWKYKGTL